jgi:hypothetical protein
MIQRYLRALMVTLRQALRGEPPPYAELYAWMARTLVLVAQVEKAAAAANLDAAAVQVRVDGRDDSMALILRTAAYHARTEYPYVLRHTSAQAFMMIQASNFNDQYRVERLLQAPEAEPIRPTLATLHGHLGALPAQNSQKPTHPQAP